ncbi:MAG: AAA family ATPase [Saprospiraceae bacterium]|nr:AAA family ATPase [Saprospiraceae bacterium]
MITKIRIRNFRQIKDQTIDLGQAVVIIGPNNGGKSSLLQAISLFAVATRAWGTERINKKSKASKRTGVAINLEEVLNIPVSDFKELWTDLIVREGSASEEGKPIVKNVRIEIIAEGYTDKQPWKTGFEFDYGRDSLIYARLTRDEEGNLYEFPEVLLNEKIGFLPSVAGLKPTEDKLEVGSILRYIGSGNTSDVLRNICYLLYARDEKTSWKQFTAEIEGLFNLLFAYLLAFPNTVNMLDEPDAHLEVIRQSNIYDKISDLAKKNNSQLIVASHSESVMSRAFGKDLVISGIFGAFEQVNQEKYVKSVLRDIGYEEFLIAKQRPFMLYFEGTTDLDFIKAFCKKLGFSDIHQFIEENVFPYPVGNDVNRVRNHFDALRKFIPDLKGYAIFDNLKRNIENNQPGLMIKQWRRNEIENYLPLPETLYNYADALYAGTFWQKRLRELVDGRIPPVALGNLSDSFWITTKISDDFLTPLFENFLDEAGIPRGIMDKSKFYQLVDYVNPDLIESELTDVIRGFYNYFAGEV